MPLSLLLTGKVHLMFQILNQGDDSHLHVGRLEFCNVVDSPKYSSTNVSKEFRNGGIKLFFYSFSI